MSSLMLDDAAAYAYGSPSSLLSTPQPDPLSQYAYDQLYPSSLSPPLVSHLDMRQHSSMSADPWMARDAIPVQSAYSTIADAPGCCPTDVYAPPSLSASNMAPSTPSYYPALAASSPVSSHNTSMALGTILAYSTIADALGCCPTDVYAPASLPASTMAPSPPTPPSERHAEPAPESRRRESSPIYQQAAFYSSYPSPTPSSSASSSYSSPSPSSSASTSYPSPSPSSSGSSRDWSKPEVIFTPRRNAAVSPNARPVVSKNSLKCSFCTYVAPKGRLPDLRRHVKTHGKKNEDFMCCGVPLAEAKERGVPTERMKEKPLVYQRIKMVGGCRKAFSRRDALLRHLRDNEGVCFGDAHAPYLLGNQ